MKTKLLILAALFALISCSQETEKFDGMTAGEEVQWMHAWMDRAYGKGVDADYDWDQYHEQSFAVREHVFGILAGFTLPDEPADIVQYFEGVPEKMIVESWAWEDKEESREQAGRFWSSVRMLQDFASGKSKYYPKEEVLNEVCTLIDCFLNISDHSGVESGYEYSYMLLAYRLAQQLVRVCPDVEALTSNILNDAAFLNLDAGHGYRQFSLIVLKGQESRNIAVLVDCHVEEIQMSKMASDVYNFTEVFDHCDEDDYDYRQALFCLHKTEDGWCLWARRDGARGFLPGEVETLPESLEEHIAQMLKEGIGYLPSKVQYDDLDEFNSAVKALDMYAKGERKYFPDKLFKVAFGGFAFAKDWDDNHAAGNYWQTLAVLGSMMEFAAYHATDINFLTDFVSADHNVGVFDYMGATDRLFHLYVTYKEHGVFRIKTLNTDDWGSEYGYDGPNRLTHVRKIGPDDARMYLFSHERPYWFSHCLCWYDGNGNAHFFVPDNFSDCVREWITEDIRAMEDKVEVVFNPKEVCWNLCVKVGTSYQPIKGSKTLYLDQNGLESRYRVE